MSAHDVATARGLEAAWPDQHLRKAWSELTRAGHHHRTSRCGVRDAPHPSPHGIDRHR